MLLFSKSEFKSNRMRLISTSIEITQHVTGNTQKMRHYVFKIRIFRGRLISAKL